MDAFEEGGRPWSGSPDGEAGWRTSLSCVPISGADGSSCSCTSLHRSSVVVKRAGASFRDGSGAGCFLRVRAGSFLVPFLGSHVFLTIVCSSCMSRRFSIIESFLPVSFDLSASSIVCRRSVAPSFTLAGRHSRPYEHIPQP